MNGYTIKQFSQEEIDKLTNVLSVMFYDLDPKEISIIFDSVNLLCKTNLIPKAFKGDKAKAALVACYGKKLGLGVLDSMNNIYDVHGKLSLHTDGGKMIVMKSGLCELLQVDWDDEKQEATAIVKRKGMSAPYQESFSLSDARVAGLINSPTWKKYPKRMCINRAIWFALRAIFSDILAGIGNAEEQYDIQYSEAPKYIEDSSSKDNDAILEELKKTNITSNKIDISQKNDISYSTGHDKVIDAIITPYYEENKSKSWKKLYGNVEKKSFELGIEEDNHDHTN